MIQMKIENIRRVKSLGWFRRLVSWANSVCLEQGSFGDVAHSKIPDISVQL